MAKKKVVQPTINEEAGLDESWRPVDTPPIVPSNPAGAPWVPNAGSQFYAGPLPSAMQHDATFVQTQYQGPRIPSYPLVPPGASGQPNVNSAVKSVTAPQFEDIQTQIDSINESGVGVEEIVDTTGTFSVSGPTNGVVSLNSNLPYIQSPNNDNFPTDPALSPQWTIIGANPNYSYSLAYGRLTLTGNNTNVDNLYGIMEPLTDATPWMYSCSLSFQTPYGSTPLCNGIAIGNSSNEYICWGYDSQSELDAVRWNSTTSVAGSLGFQPGNMGNHCYLGIQNDGTNLNFMFSADGISYMQWGTYPLAASLVRVTQIGLAIDARTQTATSYQWFRKIQ